MLSLCYGKMEECQRAFDIGDILFICQMLLMFASLITCLHLFGIKLLYKLLMSGKLQSEVNIIVFF
jgi:hypothetical protein